MPGVSGWCEPILDGNNSPRPSKRVKPGKAKAKGVVFHVRDRIPHPPWKIHYKMRPLQTLAHLKSEQGPFTQPPLQAMTSRKFAGSLPEA